MSIYLWGRSLDEAVVVLVKCLANVAISEHLLELSIKSLLVCLILNHRVHVLLVDEFVRFL